MAITDPLTATYVDASTFTVSGDYTDEFSTNRRVKADCDTDGIKYSDVEGSSYDGGADETTVNIYDSNLTSNLTDVWFGVVAISASQALPLYLEEGSLSEYFSADADGDSLHFELVVSENRDMSNPVIDVFSSDDETDWYYDDGSGFTAMPSGGVPGGSQPCTVEYAWSNSEIKMRTPYYIRWRSYDGTSYSDPFFDGVMF